MEDEKLTKKQLIEKISAANWVIQDLKSKASDRIDLEKEKERIELSLRERIKELNCLYGVSELINQNGVDLDAILQGAVNLLPISWQYPEITCGRVTYKSNEYKTSLFSTSEWSQKAEIFEASNPVGVVEVYYLKEMPTIAEGPFLREERLLINAVAESLGRAIEKINITNQLKKEQKSLEKMNIALKEILKKRQEDQRESIEALKANIEKVIIPLIQNLETRVSDGEVELVQLIKQNLNELVSPFTTRISTRVTSLTPAEILIANMIKNGLSSKEIAKIRGVSSATVHRQRENIRKKIGLRNKKINLSTYLQAYL